MEQHAATSVNGVPIRLTPERWRHIMGQHPEMADKRQGLSEAIRAPDAVYEGKGSTLVAVQRADNLYLVVIYKEIGEADGFVVTSYLTRRLGRRKLIWKQH